LRIAILAMCRKVLVLALAGRLAMAIPIA